MGMIQQSINSLTAATFQPALAFAHSPAGKNIQQKMHARAIQKGVNRANDNINQQLRKPGTPAEKEKALNNARELNRAIGGNGGLADQVYHSEIATATSGRDVERALLDRLDNIEGANKVDKMIDGAMQVVQEAKKPRMSPEDKAAQAELAGDEAILKELKAAGIQVDNPSVGITDMTHGRALTQRTSDAANTERSNRNNALARLATGLDRVKSVKGAVEERRAILMSLRQATNREDE